jgi:hypothetical protein
MQRGPTPTEATPPAPEDCAPSRVGVGVKSKLPVWGQDVAPPLIVIVVVVLRIKQTKEEPVESPGGILVRQARVMGILLQQPGLAEPGDLRCKGPRSTPTTATHLPTGLPGGGGQIIVVGLQHDNGRSKIDISHVGSILNGRNRHVILI